MQWFKLSNWKMPYQIFMLSAIASLITILVMSLIIYEFTQMYLRLQQTVQLELFGKATKNQLLQLMFLEVQYIMFKYFFTGSQTQSINRAFQMFEKRQVNNIYPSLDALYDESIANALFYGNTFCYLNLTQLDNKAMQFQNLSSFLTEYLFAYNFQKLTYFTDLTNTSYYSQNPGSGLARLFTPQTTLRMHKSRNNYDISPPLTDWHGETYVGVYSNLTALNGTMVGIVGESMYFSNWDEIQADEISMVIAQPNSDVLYMSHGYLHAIGTYSIANQSLLGFNYHQWVTMTENTDSVYTEYNTKKLSNVYITTHELTYPQSYIVLYRDDKPIVLLNHQNQVILTNLVNNIINQLLMITIGSFIVITVVQLLLLKVVLRPITTILDLTKRNIYRQSKFKERPKRRSFWHQVIGEEQKNLMAAYQNMIDTNLNTETKSDLCIQLEALEYPRKKSNIVQNFLKQLYIQIRYCRDFELF